MFQVAESQLPDVTLMVSVFYNRNIKRKEMIGWFSLGNKYTAIDDDDDDNESTLTWHKS